MADTVAGLGAERLHAPFPFGAGRGGRATSSLSATTRERCAISASRHGAGVGLAARGCVAPALRCARGSRRAGRRARRARRCVAEQRDEAVPLAREVRVLAGELARDDRAPRSRRRARDTWRGPSSARHGALLEEALDGREQLGGGRAVVHSSPRRKRSNASSPPRRCGGRATPARPTARGRRERRATA